MEPAHKTLTLPVNPNGFPKKNQHQIQVVSVYRECLKNHAASLGGHALDGCGEFMASPTSNPSDPTSLTCAACGCHRNFHRRLHRHRPISEKQVNGDNEEEEEEEEEEEGEEIHEEDEMDDVTPHMLLALSAGGISPKPQAEPPTPPSHMRIGSGQENGSKDSPLRKSRKRFRTKFSPQQKERMHELSERLGWRMHKRDEVLVEDRCREIGIGKGVFKVWMHNNKHNFVRSSFRSNNTTPVTTVTVPVTNASPIGIGTSVENGNGMIAKVNGSNEIEN